MNRALSVASRLALVAAVLVLRAEAQGQIFLADSEGVGVVQRAGDRTRFGVNVGGSINEHSANFRQLPGVPSCCPRYESGSGFGPSFGVLAEFPLQPDWWLALRGSYLSSSGTLTADEGTWFNVNNVATPGTFRHTVVATLSSFGIEPLVVWRVLDPLSVQAGLRAGFMMSNTYHQKEQIITPSSALFTTGSSIRNDMTGTIPGASSVALSLLGGLRYELPMNAEHSLMLAPEAMYSLALTSVASGLSWKTSAIRFGASVIYTPPVPIPEPPPPADLPEPPPEVDAPPIPALTLGTLPPPPNVTTVPPPPPALLKASLAVYGVNSDSVEYPNPTIRVEENTSMKMRPLLPYVFFEEGSARLPRRYERLSAGGTDGFVIDALHSQTTLDVYRHVLNIIGRRLVDHPDATISITGCTSGRGGERDNRDLAIQRASTVREYLQRVWNIAKDRMTITGRDLPAKPTRPDEDYGKEENRRVEIASDTWEVVEPVVTHDTLRTVTPRTVRFRPNITSQAGAAHWSLVAAQRGEPLKSWEGVSDIPAKLDWNLNQEFETIPRTPTTIKADLEVRDSVDQKISTPAVSVGVDQFTIQRKREERIADHTIDEYSLVLFDFDRTNLSPANTRLCDYIKEHVSPNSKVQINGFSDVYGDSVHNVELSQRRAVAVAQVLNVPEENAKGRGYDPSQFSIDSPEGRFYCRTVNVRVETAVK